MYNTHNMYAHPRRLRIRQHVRRHMRRMQHRRRVPWYLWPFWLLFKLVAALVGFTGRLVAVILGCALMLAGGILTLTVIGAIVGIPLLIIGFLMVLMGLF
jgi:hypothetical protein